MFSRFLKGALTVPKGFSITPQRSFKVAVIGASGGIGQPLCMLLKMNYMVTHLSLYDLSPVTPGVAVDLSHINTTGLVTSHKGPEQLADAVRCAHVVVIPAGVPRKPGMSRDDLFKTNARIIRDIATAVSLNAPQAIVAIITNPVNSMVPIAAEVLKSYGVFDPRRVLGVTTLDVVRACRFIGEINCMDPMAVKVPVIGGHAGVTIIPVLSQSNPPVCLYDTTAFRRLTERIQEAGTEVVQAKAGGGSATLSMAFAAARFTSSILKALAGHTNVVECAYLRSDLTEAEYFASPVLFGCCGAERILGYGSLNDYEQELLRKAVPVLIKNIETGVKFVINK